MDSEPITTLSRREFLAISGAGALASACGVSMGGGAGATPSRAGGRKYPIGIELYAVRRELAKDLPGTLRAVAGMGYEVVEFYAPYLAWTTPYARDVRAQLDDLGLQCRSTHNGFAALIPGEAMTKAIEINHILGSRYIIAASPPANTTTLDAWKRASGQLASASEQLKAYGLYAGFHDHRAEWVPLAGGLRPMDVIAANTGRDVVLQLDVGNCLEAGADPLAWINANPGRIRSMHVKDWTPGTAAEEKGFRVLLGEGAAPWRDILSAVESTGGIEYYLIEQEGSRYSEIETARRSLEIWKGMRKGA